MPELQQEFGFEFPKFLGLPPARPSYTDPRIASMAARKLLPKVIDWLDENESEPSQVQEELRQAIERARLVDGYQLAKYLEGHHHWECNSELVEILDEAEFHRSDAHRQLLKAWVKEYGVTLALPIGAIVRVKLREGEFDGIIVRLHTDEARYTVRIPALGDVEPGQLGTQGRILDKEEVEKYPCSAA